MNISRRDFLIKGMEFVCLSAMLGCSRGPKTDDESIREFEIFNVDYEQNHFLFSDQIPTVSIASLNDKWSDSKGIEYATARAIELIGGVDDIAKNNVAPNPIPIRGSPIEAPPFYDP